MYSLGVVLLDMFRNHDIGFQEMQTIHESTVKGEIEPNVAKRMPQTAQQLVLSLIQ